MIQGCRREASALQEYQFNYSGRLYRKAGNDEAGTEVSGVGCNQNEIVSLAANTFGGRRGEGGWFW